MSARPGPTGPTQAVRDSVILRDSVDDVPTCQWCGHAIGPDGYSLQHRRARGMGGSKAWATNLSANLVLMCGSGTTGCHGYVEANPTEATRNGFRIPQNADPAGVPIMSIVHGLVYLDNKGGYSDKQGGRSVPD